MAFRAIYIHLFVGIDKEFFKDMTALKASEFKDRHSVSSPFERFPVQDSQFKDWNPESRHRRKTLNREPSEYIDQTAQSQTRHWALK